MERFFRLHWALEQAMAVLNSIKIINHIFRGVHHVEVEVGVKEFLN